MSKKKKKQLDLNNILCAFCQGVRVGTAVQPATILVGSGTSGSGALAETHRDPGEDLVPEPTVQDKTQTVASARSRELAGQKGRRQSAGPGRVFGEGDRRRTDVHLPPGGPRARRNDRRGRRNGGRGRSSSRSSSRRRRRLPLLVAAKHAPPTGRRDRLPGCRGQRDALPRAGRLRRAVLPVLPVRYGVSERRARQPGVVHHYRRTTGPVQRRQRMFHKRHRRVSHVHHGF